MTSVTLFMLFSLVVTRGHSWSLVVTRGHSWSLVVIRGHSWSLVCAFRHDRFVVVIIDKGGDLKGFNSGV